MMLFQTAFAMSRRVAFFALTMAVLLSPGKQVHAQPSQNPLLSRDGGGVSPNLMIIMDDSGSMSWSHMPESTVYTGSYTTANPVGSNGVRLDPGESSSAIVNFDGSLAGTPGTSNYRQKLMRSADANTIYYNPAVRYQPWALAAGGRMANSTVTAAPRDPMNQAAGGTIDLTNIRVIATSQTWCYSGADTNCQSRSNINYDPGLYYVLGKDASGSYKDPAVASNYTEYSINSAASTTYSKASTRTDCAGATCTQTEERQNFANWFTYYRTRNLLARGSIGEAFSEVALSNFRLGYGRINSSSTSIDGVSTETIQAGVRDFDSTRKSAFFSWLYALPASGGTPLRRAMNDVGQYYSRTDSKGPWTDNPGQTGNVVADNKTCRRSYQIMVTDGYWNDSTSGRNRDLDPIGNIDNNTGPAISGGYKYLAVRPYKDGNSDTLADFAMKYWYSDLQPATNNKVVASTTNPAYWQNMVNFMVGLGVRGSLNPSSDLNALTDGTKSWGSDQIDDLWHAALNSRGEFFSAKDPTELAAAIRSSLGQTTQRELREAGVAAAATTLQTSNRKYVPMYRTGDWTGDVQSIALDANGQPGAVIWNAEAKLPLWSQRKIFTWDTGLSTPSAVSFSWSTISSANQSALGSVGTTYTNGLVDFLRGNRAQEGAGQPFRQRNGVLGDFINGTPVLVKGNVDLKYGTLPTIGATYNAFLAQKSSRAAVLFSGSNDGMLHAFKDTLGTAVTEDGKEVFAFVPRTVYANLSKLTDKNYGTTTLLHQFFVDGALQETDAYVKAPGASVASWRNYLVGSFGAGGRGVYALDVTDTANLGAATIRWELNSSNDSDLGYVYSPIEVGVLPSGKWVAVFGNGYFSDAGKAVLFVVDLETASINKLTVDAGPGNGLGGVAIQKDSQGYITALFAGDIKGQLWKMNYDATASSGFSISGGLPFFRAYDSASQPQPITQAPVIADHPLGGTLVAFGSGQLLTEADANNGAVQTIYGVRDLAGDPTPRPLTRSQLIPRTIGVFTGANAQNFYDVSGVAVNWATSQGWFLDLSNSTSGVIAAGMRMIYPAQLVSSKIALFGLVAPAQNVLVCDSATASGINLFIPLLTGQNPDYPMFDTNGDGIINTGDINSAGFATNADGIDVFLKGDNKDTGGGVCLPGFHRGVDVSTGSSTMTCIEDEVTPPGTTAKSIKDRAWRRIINPPIR
jgi:type IV pilus assembly protein PilY1